MNWQPIISVLGQVIGGVIAAGLIVVALTKTMAKQAQPVDANAFMRLIMDANRDARGASVAEVTEAICDHEGHCGANSALPTGLPAQIRSLSVQVSMDQERVESLHERMSDTRRELRALPERLALVMVCARDDPDYLRMILARHPDLDPSNGGKSGDGS